MGEKNWMSTKKVVFFKDLKKLSEALKSMNVSMFEGEEVLVKLHMGEKKNKFFPRPSYVKKHVDFLHSINASPFLYDTTVLYRGPRHSMRGYEKLASKHGFTKENVGCDVVIDENGVSVKVKDNNYEVGETLYNSKFILSLAHVKGHNATAMGGAIKNFGMGGVTSNTKKWIHHGSKPVYKKDSCTYCGVCAEVCPFNAIKVDEDSWDIDERSCFGCGVCVNNCEFGGLDYKRYDLQYTIACAAKACVDDKNVIYVNELMRISKNCDCDPYSGPIICPDIGYLISDDPVAVDKASLDLINEIKPDLFKKTHRVDPIKQIEYGEKIGLGSSKYDLVKI